LGQLHRVRMARDTESNTAAGDKAASLTLLCSWLSVR